MDLGFPIYILVLDYLLGAVMWTLLARAVLDVFIAPESQMVIARVFRQVTNPIIRAFGIVTPSFLLPLFIPVYVAWWFFIVRFYVIPFIFYGEMGLLSFPLEGGIAQLIKELFI